MKNDFFTFPNISGSGESQPDNASLPFVIRDDSMADGHDASVTVFTDDAAIRCITIAGQIEGHYALPNDTKSTKYECLIPEIVSVEENDTYDGLMLILNTVGGDIEAGLAIAELVSGMKKPSVSLVLGGGHSIGIPLAVCADRSFIVPSASMTVHPVRMNGLIVGVPQTLLYLKKMEERVISFVTRNCSVSAERFHSLMLNSDELVSDFGTVLGGEDAVREGIIDGIGGIGDAMDALKEMIFIRKKRR